MALLGVNIDHVATLRQARLAVEPDPVLAAAVAEKAGADGIVVHLREDRRHIQDRDVKLLRETVETKLNLEMAATDEMVKAALKYRPDSVCLVPEKRKELTTEGGLDVRANKTRLKKVVGALKKEGIVVTLFVDPHPNQVKAAKETGADGVELHTGNYANAKNDRAKTKELTKLENAGKLATGLGLIFNAGHGLDYKNVVPVARLPGVHELNIGFSIMARAVFTGLEQAVKEMKELCAE